MKILTLLPKKLQEGRICKYFVVTYLCFLSLLCLLRLLLIADEDDKFLKLLELLGIYQEQGKHWAESVVKLYVKENVTKIFSFLRINCSETF